MNTQEAFELALQRHQSGRLADAEALYRQILSVQPDHAEALHLLGVIAHQTGHHDLAVGLIRRSIALHPNNPVAHSNLGEAYRLLGQFDEATACYRQAGELNPQYAPAYYNLGNALRERGKLEEAVAAYRRALAIKPDHAESHNNLGMALAGQGQLDEAIAEYHRALQLAPEFVEAHNNLGKARHDRRQFAEAIDSFRRALQLKPGLAEAHNNLGAALKEQGRLDEAMVAYRQALQLKPNFAEAHHNLGDALAGQGQFDEAVDSFHQALQLKPGYAEAENNLGNALKDLGRADEAMAAYRRALQLNPACIPAHGNLGNALRERGQLNEAIDSFHRALQLQPNSPEIHNNLGLALAGKIRLEEAATAYRRALELKPDYPEALVNLGNALNDRGRPDESMAAFRRALELKPDYAEAHNNLGALLARQGLLDEAISTFRRVVELQPDRAEARSNLVYALHFHPDQDEKMIAGEHGHWNRQFAEPLKQCIRPHARDRSPERRLRIGYVSPDFRDHVVGRNLIPLFQRHDPQNFEIVCYSGAVKSDRFTEEFRRHAGQWRDTVGMADEALAEMIRQDGVDILVDLAQHMAGNRLPVFARRPAPVQVSFAGYPETTGLDAIEYRISDRYLESDPRPATQEQVFLIDSFWCYDPCGVEVAVNNLPAQASGMVTFGCLNTFRKINTPVLKLWARVLGNVPDSRLLLLGEVGSYRQRTREILEREGIEAHRVEFIEPRRREFYLEFHHRLDIALDPFPYNGHTTSLDALWMGVPVISLVGGHPISRAGFSQLSNIGLPELAAFSEDEYVGIATQLAHDLPRLAGLRATLRPRMEASPLMDAPRFARNIEAAFRTMWRDWCAPQQP